MIIEEATIKMMAETLSCDSIVIPVSVITTCYGRNRHLYNLLSSLANGSVRPSEVIIVNDDADPIRLAQYPLNIMQISTIDHDQVDNTGFDIGRNRNLGAARATHNALIFLDVDCIVAPSFIEYFYTKLQTYPNALLMGQPRYLTRPLTTIEGEQLQQGTLAFDNLNTLSIFNPYRQNFEASESDAGITAIEQNRIEQTQDYGAFWSLCFAIMSTQFEKIGGFDTHYVGYGAEDTDFAFTARSLDIDFYLTNDVIYHQQHSVYRPPLNHLESIIINANRFYDKWQHWPMAGWLSEFADMALIEWQEDKQTAISVIRQPSSIEVSSAHHPNAPYV